MTLPPRNVALVLMLSLAASGATQRAAAQSADYPNRPVSFIVPFAPGGVTSLFARILGQKLEQRLGKPFVVENRPGGGGITAAAAVANAHARRLHHHDGVEHGAGDQRHGAQEPALRSAQRR